MSYWYADGFYYFAKDAQSGLNRPIPNVRARSSKSSQPGYAVSCRMHQLFFVEQGLFFAVMKRACLALDESSMRQALDRFEHVVKFLAFGCRNCGDCTLAELAFLCPQAGCAKYLLNGPCGGSRDGWCEVYPGKKRCLYVRIYERLKSTGSDDDMAQGFVPPRDWALNHTSSWVNYFKGCDHLGARRSEGGK